MRQVHVRGIDMPGNHLLETTGKGQAHPYFVFLLLLREIFELKENLWFFLSCFDTQLSSDVRKSGKVNTLKGSKRATTEDYQDS